MCEKDCSAVDDGGCSDCSCCSGEPVSGNEWLVRTLEDLNNKVDAIGSMIYKGVMPKIMFASKRSESGIEISGGSSMVERVGELVGIFPAPSPNGELAILCVIKTEDSKEIHVAPIQSCKFL